MDGNILYALSLPLSCLALVYVFFWLYQPYRLDKYRDNLFTLRAELFDLAANGKIPFDHPAYVILRDTMNGSIRFAHQMGVLDILIYSLLGGNSGTAKTEPSYSKMWSTSTEDLDDATKAVLIKFRLRYHLRVIEQLIFTSPVFVGTMISVVAYLLLKVFSAKIKKFIESLLSSGFIGKIAERHDCAAFVMGR